MRGSDGAGMGLEQDRPAEGEGDTGAGPREVYGVESRSVQGRMYRLIFLGG